jgi:predicted  nucleic acid-binding Zn-ribbon protein
MSDTDFAVTVVATNGSQYSEAVELQLLQDLFINKAIDFETYLKNIPDQLFPNKEKILSETQESLSLQLEQQVMANQQMQQAMQKMSELMNRIEPILNENASLKGKLVQIYNEASAKIAQANQVISETDKAAMDLASQAVRSGANGMSKVQDPDASN